MAKIRAYCPDCHYPASVCICVAIRTISPRQKIIILQHPTEVKHAKNTTKLISLCVPKVTVLTGEQPGHFSDLVKQTWQNPDRFALIYPSTESKALEQNLASFYPPNDLTLILIDATWRKAYKIWQLNTWLQEIPNWHFAEPPVSLYRIRKTRLQGGLSTLEALAHTLRLTEKIDCRPLIDCFEAMQTKVFALSARS